MVSYSPPEHPYVITKDWTAVAGVGYILAASVATEKVICGRCSSPLPLDYTAIGCRNSADPDFFDCPAMLAISAGIRRLNRRYDSLMILFGFNAGPSMRSNPRRIR
jgi:hypothetical protein